MNLLFNMCPDHGILLQEGILPWVYVTSLLHYFNAVDLPITCFLNINVFLFNS